MKKVIMLLLVLTGYACTSPDTGKDGYEPIDLDRAFSQAGGISVSDMGDRVSYVPLETTDESLIGKRAYVRMLKDKLLVGSFGQPVKMFDRKTGKFIRAVGNIGQGADEYSLLLEGKNALFFVFKTNYYHIQDVKTYWGVYNKKNKSVKVTDAGKIEDTENSLFIGKLHTATSDGQLVGLVDAATFIEYAADKEGFHISEEDNPIVTIIE